MNVRDTLRYGVALMMATVVAALFSPLAPAQEPPPLIYGVTMEQLEYRFAGRNTALAWDGDAIVGTDEWKLRLQSQAEYDDKVDAFERLENQLLIQRPISAFFDAKLGLRFDSPKGQNRGFAVLGVQGLAPQWFEVDADAFLSEKGKVSARLDADYELLITNRLILTTTAELDVALSEDRPIGVGAGFSKLELGLRLRYDLIDRAFAPYIGVHYETLYGATKRIARAEEESTDDLRLVVGVRLMY